MTATLVRHAMEIIREVSMQLDKHVETKGHLDFATEADFRIQGLVTAGLSKQWPALPIIGEEAETKLWANDKDKLLQTSCSLFPPEFCSTCRPPELPIEQLCVWVDPLDGTLDFVNGHLDGVTVLVGVALKGLPELAIIGKPFNRQPTCDYLYSPKITFLRRGQPKFYTWDTINLIEQPVVRYPVEKMRVGISHFRINESIDLLIEKLGAEKIKLGGFGRKSLEMLAGNIEAFIYLNGKTSKWDSCCMEVIGSLIGGVVINCDGQKYSYGQEFRGNSKNSKGIIVAREKEVYEKLAVFKDLLKVE